MGKLEAPVESGHPGDVVGHVTALLTPGSLVAVVMHLLGVAGDEVKTKALKIVARKLEEGKSYFASDQVH